VQLEAVLGAVISGNLDVIAGDIYHVEPMGPGSALWDNMIWPRPPKFKNRYIWPSREGRMARLSFSELSQFTDKWAVGEFLGKTLPEAVARARQKTSSPVSDQVNRRVKELMRPYVSRILRTTEDSYRKSYDEIQGYSLPDQMSLGFDGKENRTGWQTEGLKEILRNPRWIDDVVRDAVDIRNNFKHVVFIGMGGSGLSVDVVKSAFTAPRGAGYLQPAPYLSRGH
jgi:hypothetical protein